MTEASKYFFNHVCEADEAFVRHFENFLFELGIVSKP